MNGELADRFVQATVQRYDVLLFDGVDISPDEPWSLPFNAPKFLMALQEMDDMNAAHNEPWWSYLHCGGPLPN
jgi:hypothetical protein